MENRKLKMGMVGGGIGAFIGAVHRLAAGLDGEIELVCGAFSGDPEKSKASGAELRLNPSRIYPSYEEMMALERKLQDDQRMDFVAIVTPNHVHFGPAKSALENGFHVIIDKPMTFSLEEAKELDRIVRETGLMLALTHTYTGYPMIKEARRLIQSGKLGKVRRVVTEYLQGWLSTKLEASEQKQAHWRTDPKRSGKAGCMGDIGTHAENLAEYITDSRVTEVCAELSTFVDGRLLDDDGNVLLRFDNGAKGVLFASQIAAGEENNMKIRVYGELGGLEWAQQEPNTLLVKWLDKPVEVYRAGGNHDYLSGPALANLRVPGGHPEGYLEAFANIYRNFALALQASMNGEQPSPENLDFPTAADGVRGMAFIDAVVESSERGQAWVRIDNE